VAENYFFHNLTLSQVWRYLTCKVPHLTVRVESGLHPYNEVWYLASQVCQHLSVCQAETE
jgi:hypothetical protein